MAAVVVNVTVRRMVFNGDNVVGDEDDGTGGNDDAKQSGTDYQNEHE